MGRIDQLFHVLRASRKQRRWCSTCHEREARPNQRTCAPCHAAYMREWRRAHPMSDEQRRKAAARAYANVYVQRGKLERQPCEVCGADDAEIHHDDYDEPLVVRWLCRDHHRALHRP